MFIAKVPSQARIWGAFVDVVEMVVRGNIDHVNNERFSFLNTEPMLFSKYVEQTKYFKVNQPIHIAYCLALMTKFTDAVVDDDLYVTANNAQIVFAVCYYMALIMINDEVDYWFVTNTFHIEHEQFSRAFWFIFEKLGHSCFVTEATITEFVDTLR